MRTFNKERDVTVFKSRNAKQWNLNSFKCDKHQQSGYVSFSIQIKVWENGLMHSSVYLLTQYLRVQFLDHFIWRVGLITEYKYILTNISGHWKQTNRKQYNKYRLFISKYPERYLLIIVYGELRRREKVTAFNYRSHQSALSYKS